MHEKGHFSTYPSTQKEKVLGVLSSSAPEESDIKALLSQEIHYIARGATNPDFLELLSGTSLLNCLYLLKSSILAGHFLLADDDTLSKEVSPFEREKTKRFSAFTTKLESLISDPNNDINLDNFIINGRKYLGMANLRGIVHLSDIINYTHAKGLINQEGLTLIHYPGSFNPFPHRGHINITRIIRETYDDATESRPRIIVSTTASNPDKPALLQTFPLRLDNLHRAFINETGVSVLGLVGDFSNKEHRIRQLLLVASFDHEKRLRFMTGSDGFIKRVEQAIQGDIYSRFLLNRGHTIIVSPRTEKDAASTRAAINLALHNFGAEIILAPTQIDSLSGTTIRSLPVRARRKFATNKFVRLSV